MPRSGIVGSYGSSERVTGRKARGLQMEDIGSDCQTFFFLGGGEGRQWCNWLARGTYMSDVFYLSLKWQKETN